MGQRIDGYCTLGVDREYDMTEADLLRSMDAAGVDRAVIAPPDRFLAVLNREGNDAILRQARAHPDRFIPACSANPWYGHAALEELQRAAGAGARMLALHPAVQGYQANDELVWPVLDVAAQAQIPVYFHTGPPGHATPWQIADLAARYASVDFIMGHCGATDFWNDVVPAANSAANIYLEASLARPFIFADYAKASAKNKGIMGSAAPLNDLAFEWRQMQQVLPAAEWPGVYGDNLRRLLERRGG